MEHVPFFSSSDPCMVVWRPILPDGQFTPTTRQRSSIFCPTTEESTHFHFEVPCKQRQPHVSKAAILNSLPSQNKMKTSSSFIVLFIPPLLKVMIEHNIKVTFINFLG